ncbi:hypothetical protein ACIF6K_28605 [Streptomyces sp. NPDC085942]|uniref:hypothetical protein n=1 Tax=Streptomyces sp. NPDC085942 TaxID=3365743 RepID=UPI0037CF3433
MDTRQIRAYDRRFADSPDKLAGLPVERFLEAVHAEGASEIDLPGSTRPLGDHQLFRTPGAFLPSYADHQGPAADSFTTARRVHGSAVKLPVWHREQDLHLADAYTAAIIKVAEHHKELVK